MAIKLSQGLRLAWLGSLATLLNDGVIGIFGATPPAAPEDAEAGTPLVLITLAGGAFTPGLAANGLGWDAAAMDGTVAYLPKAAAETWQGQGLATGTASHFRLYDNAYTSGASTTSVRLQGSVGVANADMLVSSVQVTTGVPFFVNSLRLRQAVSL